MNYNFNTTKQVEFRRGIMQPFVLTFVMWCSNEVGFQTQNLSLGFFVQFSALNKFAKNVLPLIQCIFIRKKTFVYWRTRDLPGDALVFKRKYTLEKGQKWQYWNIFQWALKIWEITASFISLDLNHQENTLFFFDCCQYIELGMLVEPHY